MFRQPGAVIGLCLCLGAPAAAQDKDARNTTGVPTTANAADSAAAPVVPAAVTPYDARTSEYLIGPEDMLDIFVWKNPELSRTVPVRPDGKVSLPLVNDIQAAGLTPSQLRDQVAKKLNEYIPSAEVTVMIREVHSVKIAVMGSVKMPGRYEIKTPATVLEMIAMAQGFSEFADKNGVVVLRQTPTGASERIEFNYRKATKGEEKENFFVRPGDVIVVP